MSFKNPVSRATNLQNISVKIMHDRALWCLTEQPSPYYVRISLDLARKTPSTSFGLSTLSSTAVHFTPAID